MDREARNRASVLTMTRSNVVQGLTLLKQYGAAGILFVGHFGIAKGVIYFGPLLVAQLLGAEVYGTIELALSIALVLALPLSFGIPTALPQITLLARPVPVIDLLAVVVLANGLLLSIAAGLAILTGYGALGPLICFVAIAAVAQGVLGAYSQTFSFRHWTVWLESLSLLLAVIIGLVCYFIGRPTVEAVTWGFGIASLLLTGVAGGALWRHRSPGFWQRWSRAVKTGAPMLIYGAAAVWIAVSGRILIGFFLSVGSVATYAFDFRVAAVVTILHQILRTGIFARLYTLRTRMFDRYLAIYFGLFGLGTVALAIGFPLAVAMYPKLAAGSGDIAAAGIIFPVVALQVFLWGASAMLEMRINRARRAGQAAIGAGIISAATIASMAALQAAGLLTLSGAVWLLALQVFLVVGLQLTILAARGLPLPRIAGMVAATVLLLALIALWHME